MHKFLSEVYKIKFSSGLQEMEYTGELDWTKFDLITPFLDQIFTCPSSPEVAIDNPSELHLIDIIFEFFNEKEIKSEKKIYSWIYFFI